MYSFKEMFDNVVSDLVTKALDHVYDGDASEIPVWDYLGFHKPLQSGDKAKLIILTAVPATEDWLKVLAGPELNW
jgi:hypothetical protein